MKRQINGVDAPWPTEVIEKWLAVMKSPGAPKENPVQANYFTPRPYVDQYNRGSSAEGFVYTFYRGGEAKVVQVNINEEER